MRVWEEEPPVHKHHSSAPVSRTNTDRQPTHSWRGPCLCRGHGRRQRIRLQNPEGFCKVAMGFFFFLIPITAERIPPLNLKIFSVETCTPSHLRTDICLFAQPPLTGWQKSDVKYLCSSLMREKSLCLFSTSGFYFINANLIDSWMWFFTCVYSGRLNFAWNCVTHWLLSTICAHQYSYGIHSKPLTTPFSCSCLLSFQTLGARWPRSLQLFFSTLERKVKKFHISRVQDPIWQNRHSTTNIFLFYRLSCKCQWYCDLWCTDRQIFNYLQNMKFSNFSGYCYSLMR